MDNHNEIVDYMNSRDPNVFINPKLIIIGNSCYRSFDIVEPPHVHNKFTSKGYTDNDDDMMDLIDIDDDCVFKITKSGQFLLEMHVPVSIFGNIIGTRGSKQQEIERQTRTRIKFPKSGESGSVVITGSTERDVILAKNRISMVVLSVKDKTPATHFISIPMVSHVIKDNFEVFKKNVLTGPPIRGVDSSIFQRPDKLHLTIATLVLLDCVEQEKALQALDDCKNNIIKELLLNTGPLKLKIEGVEIMNDDPSDVDILYGKVQVTIPKYNSTFQRLANAVLDYFMQKEFVKKEYSHVKLHVTLMNSLFRKNKNDEETSNKRISFDASSILEKYNKFYFGEVDLEFIHLSVRFSTSETSYYEALGTINLR